jgi:hypothetical protein
MASVAEIDGLTISSGPAFVGLLDTYTDAAAAFSVRRLRTAYTGDIMRIRRASDNVEADVGFDASNELSLTSPISNTSDAQSYTDFADFVDHTGTPTDAFVRYWYDQSGNANDGGQATPTQQPKIYDGSFITNTNGNTAVQFIRTSSTVLRLPSFDMYNNGWFCSTVAEKNGSIGDQKYIDSFGAPGDRSGEIFKHPSTDLTTMQWPLSGDPSASVTGSITTDVTYLWTSENTSANLSLYINGSSAGSSSITSQNDDANGFDIGGRSTVEQGYSDTKSSEIIYWNSNQSDNRTGIEVNINNHFAIGNFPNPTSGLLFDYSDAAAAYSVRQLANTAALSMRVRRETGGGTGDDDEADVLFDFTLTDPTISLDSRINNPSAGVASTTLGEFLNATGYTDVDNLTVVADGFCDTWYDQSGNGNDVEQTVPGSQPQIFDSASPTDLITENGKPCLKIVNDYFVLSPTLSLGSSMLTIVSCHKGASFQETLTWDQRLYYRGSGGITLFANSSISGGVTGISTQHLITAKFDSTTSIGRFNGTQFVSGTTGTTGTIQGIMSRGIGLQTTPNATVQEMIQWPTWDTSNTAAMENEIMTHFSIT